MVALQGREILDSELLPRLDCHPGSDEHVEGERVDKVAGVTDAVVGHDGKDGITSLPYLSAGSSYRLGKLKANSIHIEQSYHVFDVGLGELAGQPEVLPDDVHHLLVIPSPLLGMDVRLLQMIHQLVGPRPLVVILRHEEKHPEYGDVRVGDVECVVFDVLGPGCVGGEEVTLPAVSLPPGTDLVTHGEPAGRTPVVAWHLSQTLQTDRLTLVVWSQHSPGVHQDQLQWPDVSCGEQDSALVREAAGSEGQTVVLVSVAGEMFRGTEVDGRTVGTFLTANCQAKKTIVLPGLGAGAGRTSRLSSHLVCKLVCQPVSRLTLRLRDISELLVSSLHSEGMNIGPSLPPNISTQTLSLSGADSALTSPAILASLVYSLYVILVIWPGGVLYYYLSHPACQAS